jgi:DNA replication protein DnaC
MEDRNVQDAPSDPQTKTPNGIEISADAAIKARTELVEHRLSEAGVPARYLCAGFKSCLAPKYLKDFCETWSRNPSGFLYIHGGIGRGKTYLAACILKRFFGYHPRLDFEAPGRYLADDFPDRIRAAIKTDATEALVKSYANCPGLLVIDDLGVEKLNDWSREQFCRIIYRRYDAMLPTLITSNFDIEWLSGNIDARVADRIAESDQVFEFTGPNRRLKRKE